MIYSRKSIHLQLIVRKPDPMYTLTQHLNHYKLTNTLTNETLTINGLGDLSEIYYLIQDHMAKGEALRMLSVAEMIRYAHSHGGPDLKSQTITNGCSRNGITNAIKPHGRWLAPEASFHDWFTRYLARRLAGDQRYSATN